MEFWNVECISSNLVLFNKSIINSFKLNNDSVADISLTSTLTIQFYTVITGQNHSILHFSDDLVVAAVFADVVEHVEVETH